jgi:hypothetical protein
MTMASFASTSFSMASAAVGVTLGQLDLPRASETCLLDHVDGARGGE